MTIKPKWSTVLRKKEKAKRKPTTIQDIGGIAVNDTNAKLRGWMAERKISGRKFAEMIDMPYDTFKSKMADKTDWKMPEIVRILQVTGLRFEEAF